MCRGFRPVGTTLFLFVSLVSLVTAPALSVAAQEEPQLPPARPYPMQQSFGPGVITGVVCTPEGEPLGWARVVRYPAGDRTSGDAKGSGLDDGRFTFENVMAGQHDLIVSHPAGYTTPDGAPVQVDLPAGETVDLRIVLQPEEGQELAGRVVTEDGQPAPRMRVRPSSGGERYAITDAQGRWRMFGVREMPYGFQVFGPVAQDEKGRELPIFPVRAYAGDTDITITLKRVHPGRIEGVVLPPPGGNLEGAEIGIVKGHGTPFTFHGDEIYPVDSETGGFAIDVQDEGDFVVMASAPGCGLDYAHVTVPPDGTVRDVRLQLKAAHRIEGEVLPPPGGSLEGAEVTVLDGHAGPYLGSEPHFQPIDADTGQFQLETIRDGKHTVVARAPGCALAWAYVTVPRDEGVRNLLLQLAPGRSIAGRVVDGEGRPVKLASVRAHLEDDKLVGDDMMTDESGSFLLRDLPQDTLTIKVRPWDREGTSVSLPPRQMGPLEIVLPVGATIVGRVTLDGKPLEGMTVDGCIWEPGQTEYMGPPNAHAITDAAGRYRIEHAKVGHADLMAYDRDHRVSGRYSLDTEDGKTHVADFDLRSPTSTVTGSVLIEGQAPRWYAPTLFVQMSSGAQISYDARRRDDGTFEFPRVASGPAILRVGAQTDAKDHSEKTLAITIPPSGTIDVPVDIEPGGSLSGKVTGIRPGETIWITVYQGAEDEGDGEVLGSTLAFTNGIYVIAGIAPGRHTVVAEAESPDGARASGRTASAAVEIRINEGTEVDLQLPG